MQDAKNLDVVAAESIDEQVRGARHSHLTRPKHSASSTDCGCLGEKSCDLKDPSSEPSCRGRILCRNVVTGLFKVSKGRLRPYEVHVGRSDSDGVPQESSH